MAYFTLWVAAVDFGRYFLERTRPHHRALHTLDELSFLSLPLALVGAVLCITHTGWCRRFLVGVAGLALAITLGYPYAASLWAYVVIQVSCIAAAWFLFGRAFVRGKCWMGVTEMTLLAYISAETVVALGDYFPQWPSVWSLMMGLNIAVIALHIGWEATVRVRSRQEYD